jgi:hypothetical protein
MSETYITGYNPTGPVEYETKPAPDMKRVEARNLRVASQLRGARAAKASPAGPRTDEWTGKTKPSEDRSGSGEGNKYATGPAAVPYVAPIPVRHTFLPAPKRLPVASKEAPEEYIGTLTNTSAIGCVRKGRYDALPCGPAPVYSKPEGKEV